VMLRPGLWSGRVRAALLGFALLSGLGCAKKVTSVDPSFTTPEGKVTANSILVLNRNLGNPEFLFKEFKPFSDREPAGPSPGDTLASTELALLGTEGVVEGLVFDSTQASRYQVFHRESNGGLRQLFDYDLLPKQRWLDTQWEKYSWVDQRIEPDPGYEARGLVGGTASAGSPISNAASSPFESFGEIYAIPITFPEPLNDTVLVVSWPSVPGAAGYFLHAYEFRADFNRTHQLNITVAQGAPRPINDGQVSDALLSYISEGTQCGVGPVGEHLLAGRGISKSSAQIVRVTAIDCSGRLLGFSPGEAAIVKFDGREDRVAYMVYFQGGYAFPRPPPPTSPVLEDRLRRAARFRVSPATAERITYRIRYY
jgi:hypothetical protein